MLEFKNVSAGYGSKNVINNINLTINEGENLSIIGPNGSGKSTLLKIIAGLIPYEGSIKLKGTELSQLNHKKLASELALMEQNNPVAFSYTVYETALLGRYRFSQTGILSAWSKEDHQEVEDCLKNLDLWELKDRSIRTLSGGQFQLVHFARTLVQDTPTILLDEPTNHLDLKYQAELIKRLNHWSKKGHSTLIGVFHDINIALNLSERILLLNQGEILKIGEPKEVLTSQLLKQVYGTDIIGYMLDNYRRWQDFV